MIAGRLVVAGQGCAGGSPRLAVHAGKAETGAVETVALGNIMRLSIGTGDPPGPEQQAEVKGPQRRLLLDVTPFATWQGCWPGQARAEADPPNADGSTLAG